MKNKIFVLILLLISVSIFAENIDLYRNALSYYENNDMLKSRELFTQYIKENPDGKYVKDAYYKIYRTYSFAQLDNKLEIARKISEIYINSKYADYVRIDIANYYINDENYFEASKWLMEIYLFSYNEDLKNDVQFRLIKYLNKNLQNTEIEFLLYNYPENNLIPAMLFKLYTFYEENMDYQKSEFYRQKLIIDYPNSEYTKKYIMELENADNSKKKIAIVLPTTGEYAPFAETVRRGCVIANEEENIDIVIFNTESNAVKAVEIIDSIAKDRSFIAVIGPMTSMETIATGAYLYEREKLPLLSPTATDGDLLKFGENIFLVNKTLLEQAVFTADYLSYMDSIKNIGIIYPEDSYGKTLAYAFKNRAKFNGLNVLFDIAYVPGTSDFQDQLSMIKEMKIDAIYLPVSSEDVILLSTQIAYNEISTLLVGSDSWYNRDITRLAKDYVQGAIIVKQQEEDKYSDRYINFKLKYMKKYNIEPNRFAMLSYDTFKLLAKLIKNGYNTRKSIIKYLHAMKYYKGISGKISFTGMRNDFTVYEIQGSEFIKKEKK